MTDRISVLPGRGAVERSPADPESSRGMEWRNSLARTAARGSRWGLAILGGVLIGRVPVSGSLLPFGTACVIAVAAAGRPRLALGAAAGAMLGAWTAPRGPAELQEVLAPLLAWLVAAVVGRRFRNPGWRAAAGALTLLLVRLAAAFVSGASFGKAGALGAMELAAALAFLPAALLHGSGPARLSHGQTASVLALAGFFIAGTRGIGWHDYELAEWLGRAAVLLAGLAGGAGVGAAAGTSLAIIYGASGMPGWVATVLAPAGFGAGLGASWGKPAAALGFIAGQLLFSPYAGSGAEIGSALAHSFLAVAAVALVPRGVVRRAAARLPGTLEAERLGRERQQEAERLARQQLTRVAAVFEELSATFQDGRALHNEREFDQLVARACERICRGCPKYAVCWDRYVYQTYRDLMAVAAAGIDGPVSSRDFPEGLRQRCIKPAHLAKGLSQVLEAAKTEMYWQQRLEESRQLVPRQLAGVAGIIAGAASQLIRTPGDGEAKAGPGGAPRYEVRVGVAQATREGAPVSGDCFRRVDLDQDRVCLILSDGMGSGERAAAESRAAVAMLQRFQEAGFSLEFSVQTVNSVLLLRSPEETFATIDVCLVDLRDGTVRMLKLGAAPTFVRRANDVEVVRSASVPAGILSRVDAKTETRRLEAGDLIVMITDGALESQRGGTNREESIRRALRRLPGVAAGAVAQELLNQVQANNARGVPDDVTVVAVQLVERGRGSGGAKARAVAGRQAR
ncbi:MAG: SpoIIE family protein phosphatase [Firmicutes bacterium]|nr:SpoIIE family protein phosphatase [Bacillota bacterium]